MSPIVGLKTLWKGNQDLALVDIVAVHGIGANPDTTWTSWKTSKNWLQAEDMLPNAVPKSRIMRFAYESQWLGQNTISQTLSGIADTLLETLEQERAACPNRPIIFIGHCFGGIVIEKALLSAKQRSKSMIDHTAGVIFIATPHRGTHSQSLASVLAGIVEYADLGQRSQLIDTLKQGNAFLDDMVSHFCLLSHEIRIPLCCFYEQRMSDMSSMIRKAIPFMPKVNTLLVGQHSASLDGVERFGLGLNHFEINKFDDPDDGYYKLLQSQIRSICVNAHEVISKRNAKASTIFHVPRARNMNFVGRNTILDQLETIAESQGGGQTKAALYGLGGVGKTDIAVELAYRSRNRFNVFWAQGSSLDLFNASFLTISEKIGLSTGAEGSDFLVICDWLNSEKSGRWILIVDNVENLDSIPGGLPMNRGCLIFTTPDRDIAMNLAGAGNDIHIHSMMPEEAASLFFKLGASMPNLVKQESEVIDLVTILGGLPLAIIQAFAYIRYHSMSVRRYASKLKEGISEHSDRTNLQSLLPKSSRGIHSKEMQELSVLETWDMSYKPLITTNGFALRLLHVLSLLSSEPVSRTLLSLQHLAGLGGTSEDDIDQALSLLCSLAFVNVYGEDENRAYQLHSLVILWARTKIEDKAAIADVGIDLILDAFESKSQNTMQSRAQGSIVVSHAQSIESFCDANKSVNPEKTMTLKWKIGQHLTEISLYAESEKRITKCIDYYADKAEPTQELGTCYIILGRALQGLSKFDEALRCYDKAYDLAKARFGEKSHLALDTLGYKAATLFSQGKTKESLKLYIETYDGIKSTLGDYTEYEQDRMAHLLNGMGLVYNSLMKYERANECYSEGLEIATRDHGYEHPMTWRLLTNLVEVLKVLGKHQQAEQLFSNAVRALQQEAPALNTETTDSTTDIGNLSVGAFPIIHRLIRYNNGSTISFKNYVGTRLQNGGQYSKALKWFEDAYQTAHAVLGIKSLTTLDIAHNLCATYSRLGETEKAREFRQIALEGSIALLGPDHPSVMTSLSELSYDLIDEGKYDEALETLDRIYEWRARELGPTHKDTLSTVEMKAEVYHDQELYEKAREYYQEAIRGYGDDPDVKCPELVDTKQNMAELLMEIGEYEESIKTLREVISVREQPARLHMARSMLGKAMVMIGQKEGLDLTADALRALEELGEDSENFTVSAVWNVAESLRHCSRLSEALVNYDKALAIYEEQEMANGKDALKTWLGKGDTLELLGRGDQALEAYRQANDISEKTLDLEDPLRVTARKKCEEQVKMTQMRRRRSQIGVFIAVVVLVFALLIFQAKRIGLM